MNRRTFALAETFNYLTPYTTSATKNMQAGSVITVAGGAFSATLEANSVTTFVEN